MIKGLAHITGGGFLENIPRILPNNVSVEITRGSWAEPPIFGQMQRLGNVSDTEMFRTFNMGIGMILICSQFDAEAIAHEIGGGYDIGKVTVGDRSVKVS